MAMHLLEDFSAISQLVSAEALHQAADRLIGELEFERFELQVVTGGLDGDAERWSTVGNVPLGYMPLWLSSEAGRTCPVMQHAKRSSSPLYWDEGLHRQAGMMPKWETQKPWGYGTGFIVASHLRPDKHVVVAVERENALQDSLAQKTHKFALFQLFATCAVDACLAAMGDEASQASECPLGARELQVLQWTLAGKTAWEVGAILGIAEGTAAQYLSAAARKLGAVNKHQAALKALRLGWIV